MTVTKKIGPVPVVQIPVSAMAACTFAMVLLMLAAPRGAHVEYGILALVPAIGLLQRDRLGEAFRRDGMLVLLGAVVAYLLINTAWSLNPKGALRSVALDAAYAVVLRIAICGLAGDQAGVIKRLARAFAIAAVIGAGFILVQVSTGQILTQLLMKISPGLGPDLKHVSLTDGHINYVLDYVMNRNLAALSVVLWPALLVFSKWGNRQHSRWLTVGLAAVAGIAIFKSPHETSQLALIFSGAVFGIARWWPSAGRRLVTTGWIIATLAVVPIALMAFRADLHHARLIPESGRARIILWDYTAEQTLKHPLLGVGIGSTERISAEHMNKAERPAGFAYPLDTGRHSHNVYLQTWFELGAVGAALLLLLGLGMLAWIGRQGEAVQPYALAAFTSAAVVAAFSYGLWQEWFQALFFASIVLTRLGREYVERGAD